MELLSLYAQAAVVLEAKVLCFWLVLVHAPPHVRHSSRATQ
jgi:hypothetical protein